MKYLMNYLRLQKINDLIRLKFIILYINLNYDNKTNEKYN